MHGRPIDPHRGQSWKTFLKNHSVWACDFLQLYDIWFRPIFAFFIVNVNTKEVVRVAVTRAPTEQWTAQQLREATPFGAGPQVLIRDGDKKYGPDFDRVAEGAGIEVLQIAPCTRAGPSARTPTTNRTPQVENRVERTSGTTRVRKLRFELGEQILHAGVTPRHDELQVVANCIEVHADGEERAKVDTILQTSVVDAQDFERHELFGAGDRKGGVG
jgi:hypothetical protein